MDKSSTLASSVKNRKANAKQARFAQVVRQDPNEVERLRKEVLTGTVTDPNLVIINEKELARMKKEAVIVTLDERLQQNKILEEQKEKQQSAAMAKKKKMMELEE